MKMLKFGPSEIFRLRHSLVALVEELKFHKKCDLDSESKIQELVNRNHAMHKEWDAERQKARLKEEGFERAINELKLEYEKKLRRLDVDQRQKNVKNESKLFVKDRMKEDMRQLQMTIFHQEKTIKELETKLQAQESSSERVVSQWAGVDKKMSELTEIYQHTLDSVNRLEQGVVKAVSLNRQLSYRNHHHDCLMKEKLSEVGRLQQELLQARIEASAPSLDECQLQEMRSTIGVLQSKIHMLETQGQKQNEALTEQTERARLAISNLQTAQELVTRHLDTTTKCRAEASKLSAECAALTAQCTALKEQLSIGQGLLVERDMAIKTAMEDWQQKESQLEAAITSKDVQLQSLELSKVQLQEGNHKLLESNEQLNQRLLEFTNPTCVSTSDIGLLAGSSVLSMTDISLQVSPDVRSLPTQTSQHMDTTSTQTSQHMDTVSTQNTVDVKSINNHILTDVNILTTCASPAGTTTRATRTSRPPVGYDVLQPHSHETVPSCVQPHSHETVPSCVQPHSHETVPSCVPPHSHETVPSCVQPHSHETVPSCVQPHSHKTVPSCVQPHSHETMPSCVPPHSHETVPSCVPPHSHETVPSCVQPHSHETVPSCVPPHSHETVPSCVQPHSHKTVPSCVQPHSHETMPSCVPPHSHETVPSCVPPHSHETVPSCVLPHSHETVPSCVQPHSHETVPSCVPPHSHETVPSCVLPHSHETVPSCVQPHSHETVPSCVLPHSHETVPSCVLPHSHETVPSCVQPHSHETVPSCVQPHSHETVPSCVQPHSHETVPSCVPPHSHETVPSCVQPHSHETVPSCVPPHSHETVPSCVPPHSHETVPSCVPPHSHETMPSCVPPHSHETMPSCVQIDASTTCPSSAQTIPPCRTNRAADTFAPLTTKSLPRVTAGPHMLPLAPLHGFLDKPQGSHGATIHRKPVKKIQLFSASFTAEQTPGTLTKFPSRVAFDPHASKYVQETSKKYQVEASSTPGSAHVQPASTTSNISAHMGHTFTEAQPRDGAQYRSVDQELEDKYVGQPRDGAQDRSTDQESLDKHLGSNELAMCLLTAEATQTFTRENTSLQDHPQSPPDIDTADPDFESSQDKHQAHENHESSMNITQTDELYTHEAARVERFSLPRSIADFNSNLSYTQNNVVKQFPCYASTRMPHALADGVVKGQQKLFSCSPQNNTAANTKAHDKAAWKQASPPASSNMAGQTSQEAGGCCCDMGAALFNTDDDRDTSGKDVGDTSARDVGDTSARDGGDTSARDGGDDIVHIKQEIFTNLVDVSQVGLECPSLQGEVCQVSTGMPSCNNWCCSSTSDELSLLHRESQFDGSGNATSKFDNNNSRKPDSNETLKMIDNINDNEEKISKTFIETPPWPDSIDNDVKIYVKIDEIHMLTDHTRDDDGEKIDVDVRDSSILTDNTLTIEKVHVNKTHTVTHNAYDDDNKMGMNVTKTHVLTDSRHDNDDEKTNFSVTDILTDKTHDNTKVQISVNERRAFLDDTDSLMTAGRSETSDRTSSTAFSVTDSTHQGILAAPRCSQIPLSSAVLNVAHTAPDNLLQCTIASSIIPLENVGEDQYLNVVHDDILPTRVCGFGKMRPHARRLDRQTRQFKRKPVRRISLPQSVFIVDFHLNWSATADYKIIYQHDGTASIQESSLLAQTGSCGTSSNRAQVSDIPDNCATAAMNLHTSSDCVVKGVNIAATSRIQHPTSYITNVPGLACLSLAGDKVSSKQDGKLTQDVSEQIRGQVSDPYNFLAAENVLSFSGATPEVPEANRGQVRDPYDFHTAENLVASPTAKSASGNTRAAPRSLKLAKPCRVSGTASLACLRSPFLSSLGVSSDMITRADLALSSTSSSDLLKSQPLAKASDALMPSQVHLKTESSSHSRMIRDLSSNSRVVCDMSLSTKDLQCSQTSSVGSSDCQQVLSHQSSQLFIDVTSQFLTNQTSSCGSNISDKCGLQTKSSHTVNTTAPVCSVDELVCSVGEKEPGANSPDDLTNPPGANFQQIGICPERSQVQSKGQHTPQPGDMDRGCPVLLSRTSPARNTSHKVVSRRDLAKSDTKLKGILKGPYSRRPKSSTCKSVRFPLELVKHIHGLTQDSQRPDTPVKRRISSLSSSEDLGTTDCNISAAADPSASAAKQESSSQSDPKSCSQHKKGNSIGQATSYIDPKLSSQHTYRSCSSLAADADIITNDENRYAISSLPTDGDTGASDENKYAISSLATSPHTDCSTSGQYANGNSSSLATSSHTDPSTSGQHKYVNSSSLATSTHIDSNATGQHIYSNFSSLTTSHSDPNMSGQYDSDQSHIDPSMNGQHSYVNSESLDVKGDPNTTDKYGNCRSLAILPPADPSSSSPFTHSNSTYLTNSGSPAGSPAASTSCDPSASEATPQPVLVVPESPYLQLSSIEQEILSTPDDDPVSSQSPDTIISSQISRYLRSHVFESINSSPLLKDDIQSPAVKKQKTG